MRNDFPQLLDAAFAEGPNIRESGRAGESPVSLAADAINELEAESMEWPQVMRQIREHLRSPTTHSDPEWSNLCALCALIDDLPRDFGVLIHGAFNQGIPREVSARAEVMGVMLDLGRKLTRDELENEQQLKSSFPLVWADACFHNPPLVPLAVHCLSEALGASSISVQDLLVYLPTWYQLAPDELCQAASDWQEMLPRESKNLLRSWFRECDIPDQPPTRPFLILNAAAIAFLRRTALPN